MNTYAKRQRILVNELHVIARRIDELALLGGVFRASDDYLSGQCNSCLITACQQLETVVSTIRDCGDYAGAPDENLVLPKLERSGKPRSTRGLETAPATKTRVVRARSRVGASVVAGGSR